MKDRPRLAIALLLVACIALGACGGATSGIASADEFVGPWYSASGRPLRDGTRGSGLVLHAALGPSSCREDSAVFLELAWPVGTSAGSSSRPNVYVRDPRGAVRPDLATRFAPIATLPSDARDTGFHHGIWRLSVVESDPSSIFLVGPARTERWPLAAPSPARCA